MASRETLSSHRFMCCHSTLLRSSPVAISSLKTPGGLLAWLCTAPQTQQGLGESAVPSSRGFYQAPGVGLLPLANSSTTRLKSPTAPSLFSRATLSLGMTTWARSLVMREIS